MVLSKQLHVCPEKPNLPRGPRALRCFPSIQLVRCCTWWLEITNNLIRAFFLGKTKAFVYFYIRVSSGYCMRRGVSFFVLESMHLRICGVDSANTHAYVHSYQCVKGHLERFFLQVFLFVPSWYVCFPYFVSIQYTYPHECASLCNYCCTDFITVLTSHLLTRAEAHELHWQSDVVGDGHMQRHYTCSKGSFRKGVYHMRL